MINKLEEKMDKRNEEITEEILSDSATLVDVSPVEIKDYIKCKGNQIENLEGRWKIAYGRCPKCRAFISIYRDEIDSDGQSRIVKKCACGFKRSIALRDWKER